MTLSYKPMSTLMKIAFWFVAVNALAGALSLMLLPRQTDRLFFWEITPPINAALFGALYLGGAAVVGWVTLRGQWEPARFLVPVLVTAGALITLTTALHLGRFDPGFKLAYWLVVYIGAPLLALWFYIERERGGASWKVTWPVRPATRVVAVGLGAVLVVLGVAILAFPQGAVAQWPWPTTPLVVRIFASWFSAFGAGLLWFHWEREWTRVRHVATLMIAASALDLLMVFVHRGDLTSTGINLWVYVFHLALFGVIGAAMHWLQRGRPPQAG
jgi:hypothetical protein